MTRLLLATLGALLAASASAQLPAEPNAVSTHLQCLAICSCKVQPGTPDPCKRYWTFKNTITGPIRVENSGPKVCGDAVEDNLIDLERFYGKRPEISLPTREMANAVASFNALAPGPLPVGRELDSAPKIEPSQPLAVRISVQGERVAALAKDANVHSAVDTTTATWEAASSASQRLVRRSMGAERFLSLAKPWPSLTEFAPKVWDMQVCNRTQKVLSNQLEKRLQVETDIAWSFAFHDDWVVFRKPFFSTSAIPIADDKDSAFVALGRPFLVETKMRVAERSNKTLFTLSDVKAFRDAVEKAAASIAPVLADRRTQTAARRTELRSAFDREKAAVVALQADVETRQRAGAAAKEAIMTTTASRTVTVNKIGEVNSAISDTTTSIASLSTERDKRAASRDEARTTAQVAADRVRSAQQALDTVVLNCNGLSYEGCQHQAAKLEYDRLRYKALQTLAAARQVYLQAAEKLQEFVDAVLALETAVFAKRTSLAGLKAELAKLHRAKDDTDVLLATQKANASKLQAEIDPLLLGMEALQTAAERLEALRP
jgi:hypothetical protein